MAQQKMRRLAVGREVFSEVALLSDKARQTFYTEITRFRMGSAVSMKTLTGASVYEQVRLDGGISGWEKAGLPVEHISSTIPLFRQIQIAAGSLVLIGVIGSAFWHPFFWLSAFVGAGLVFAGISGFCGLGVLLSHMPWNRR